jgi:hypothetical protein
VINPNGFARSQSGEATLGSSDRGHILGLDTAENGRRTLRVGDVERVGGQLGERASGVVQELDGLITCVGDDGGNVEAVRASDSVGA